jgi:hypothetical protein
VAEHHFPSGGEDHSARRGLPGRDVRQGIADRPDGRRVGALLLQRPAGFPHHELAPLGPGLVVLSGVEVHCGPRTTAVEEWFQERQLHDSSSFIAVGRLSARRSARDARQRSRTGVTPERGPGDCAPGTGALRDRHQ